MTINPPYTIPAELYGAFTCQGAIPVEYIYANDVAALDAARLYEAEAIEKYIALAKRRFAYYYSKTDLYLYEALKRFPIAGKEVAILGSTIPWYESMALAYGASATTIDYNRVISTDPRLKVLTLREYEDHPTLFDALLSISSFEHDGLGRDGDPICPDGDLLAMKRAKRMLKEGGYLYLAVPVERDLLCWNSHRLYGRIRLKELLRGWSEITAFGFSMEDLDRENLQGSHQPVFVLKK